MDNWWIIIILIIVVLFIIYTLSEHTEYFISSSMAATNSGKAFIGAWVSDIGCGKTLKHALLASALPQNWVPLQNGGTILPEINWPKQETFFEGAIAGDYEAGMSDGYTKYLISVGGSNASPEGWTTFLNNPEMTARQLHVSFKERGLLGIDFDLEGTTAHHQRNIKELVTRLKNLNPNYIVVYTVLLGSRDTFSDLINDGQMDYVALMLYDGGMYEANGTGAGCDWAGWAELFLSKCSAGCRSPLQISAQDYCAGAACSAPSPAKCGPINFDKLNGKIVLAVIVDASGKRANKADMKLAMDLCAKYNGAGIYMWVLPGWAYSNTRVEFCDVLIPDMCDYNAEINNYFEFYYTENGEEKQVSCSSTCGTQTAGCSVKPQNICRPGCCKASACGKKKQGVTDSSCEPCASGQTYWPCEKNSGLCECKG